MGGHVARSEVKLQRTEARGKVYKDRVFNGGSFVGCTFINCDMTRGVYQLHDCHFQDCEGDIEVSSAGDNRFTE
jgi:hypothetical protein